jgi:hypothetical protein
MEFPGRQGFYESLVLKEMSGEVALPQAGNLPMDEGTQERILHCVFAISRDTKRHAKDLFACRSSIGLLWEFPVYNPVDAHRH